jgi:hypothetical protein
MLWIPALNLEIFFEVWIAIIQFETVEEAEDSCWYHRISNKCHDVVSHYDVRANLCYPLRKLLYSIMNAEPHKCCKWPNQYWDEGVEYGFDIKYRELIKVANVQATLEQEAIDREHNFLRVCDQRKHIQSWVYFSWPRQIELLYYHDRLEIVCEYSDKNCLRLVSWRIIDNVAVIDRLRTITY